MNNEQAYAILDQVCSKFVGTRAEHEAIAKALEITRLALFPIQEVAEIIPPSSEVLA